MVSFKDLMLMASVATSASAQNAGQWGTNSGYDDTSTWDNPDQRTEFTAVTLLVHTHTPIQEFAEPDAIYTNRRRDGCIAVSSMLMRSAGTNSEPWVFVSNDINDCAVVDIKMVDPATQTYGIYI